MSFFVGYAGCGVIAIGIRIDSSVNIAEIVELCDIVNEDNISGRVSVQPVGGEDECEWGWVGDVVEQMGISGRIVHWVVNNKRMSSSLLRSSAVRMSCGNVLSVASLRDAFHLGKAIQKCRKSYAC